LKTEVTKARQQYNKFLNAMRYDRDTDTFMSDSVPGAFKCRQMIITDNINRNIKPTIDSRLLNFEDGFRNVARGAADAEALWNEYYDYMTDNLGNPNSIKSLERDLPNIQQLQRQVQEKVAPWTTRQLVEIMQSLAKTEQYVESLFATPVKGFFVENIRDQQALAVQKGVQAAGLIPPMDRLEAKETEARANELRAARTVHARAGLLTWQV
jgi:hypothetical protein